MKVLLLHPEDVPWRGPWANRHWDLIVDSAFAGKETYADWSRRCGAPGRSIHDFAGTGESYASIRQMLDLGSGRLVDRTGLDWWEIIGVVKYHELQALYLLQCLTRDLGPEAEYHATQETSLSKILSSITGRAIPAFRVPGSLRGLLRPLSAALRLGPAASFEIACDKWDPEYSIRRHFTKWRRAALQDSTVLLPSAYSNVSRLVLQYANDLPQRQFLLAATRRSGMSVKLPQNVQQTFLAAYAKPFKAREAEENELEQRWTSFVNLVFKETEALRCSLASGLWADFLGHLRTGLGLRDAWHTLLEEEPIAAVLCGDDLNYYTRIPLILAAKMGLNAAYCYHGALDGGLLFKKPYAGTFLVKSEMEREYLLRCSRIDRDKVQMGEPSSFVPRYGSRAEDPKNIVFFSQKYEVLAGRAKEIYRDIVPGLCAIAVGTGHRVVVKLHPFENIKDRKKLLRSVLTAQQMAVVDIVADCSLQEILNDAWCGIGVDSSVATESQAVGVPYFLCGWLDYSGFGYSQQLARFGMGRMLYGPSDLDHIPEMVANWKPSSHEQQLWKRIDSNLLERVLFAAGENSLKQCAS
jgi:hypothetical protein